MKKVLVVLLVLAVALGAVYLLTRECKHEYPEEYEVIKAATCAEKGEQAKKCVRCGEYGEAEALEKLPHNTEWKTVLEATCTAVGMEQEVCVDCNAILAVREIPMAKHVAGEDIIDQAATCTKNGAKHTECVNCGKELSSDVVKATGHVTNKQNWKTIADATCTEKGQRNLLCDVCGVVVKTEEIESLGHQVEDWSIISEVSCTADGERTGVCSVCKRECFELIPAWGHHFTEWLDNPTDYWSKDCEIVIPTCTTDGFEYRYCATCQTIESRFVKAFGHTAGEWQIKEEATCTQTGLQEQFCVNCEVLLTTSVTPLAEHTPDEWITTVDPTCYSVGKKEQGCSECGRLLEWQTIPMTEHSFAEITDLAIAPSCTAEGEKSYECAEPNCHATKKEILEKTSHTLQVDQRSDATCDIPGYIVWRCTAGGCEYSKNEPIASLGHDYDGGAVQGQETLLYTCQRNGCRHTYTEEIPEIVISYTLERNETVSGVVDVRHMKEYRISATGGYGDKEYLVKLFNGDTLVEEFSNAANEAISVTYRVGKNETDLYRLEITVTDEIGNQAEKTVKLADED